MLPLATVPSGLVVEMLILSLEWASALIYEKAVKYLLLFRSIVKTVHVDSSVDNSTSINRIRTKFSIEATYQQRQGENSLQCYWKNSKFLTNKKDAFIYE